MPTVNLIQDLVDVTKGVFKSTSKITPKSAAKAAAAGTAKGAWGVAAGTGKWAGARTKTLVTDEIPELARDIKNIYNSSLFQNIKDTDRDFGLIWEGYKALGGREFSGGGKALAYTAAGGIAAYGMYKGYSTGNNRVIMGNIDADLEGLPNKVSSNASPVNMSEEGIGEAMASQRRRSIRNSGADGELAMSLHRLYGTGQQRFI